MQQTQSKKQEVREPEKVPEELAVKSRTPEQQALIDGSSDLLDELDLLLEDLDQDLASKYVQEGGE